MPLTAIEDFEKLGEKDPFYRALSDCCKQTHGLWNERAERMLLEHFNVSCAATTGDAAQSRED